MPDSLCGVKVRLSPNPPLWRRLARFILPIAVVAEASLHPVGLFTLPDQWALSLIGTFGVQLVGQLIVEFWPRNLIIKILICVNLGKSAGSSEEGKE